MKAIKFSLILAWFSVIGSILLMASVPPVSRDALTHHLAVPKLWVEAGGMRELPDIAFSYYPQLIDLLYVFPILAGHDTWAKYLHFAFALATAVIVFLFIRRRLGSLWGSVGALMFITVPLIVKLSVTAYVDLGLLFFTTASLFSTLIWLEKPDRSRWLVLAGLCAGLALSTKYNAIVSIVALGLLLAYFRARQLGQESGGMSKLAKDVAIFGFLALLVFSPWLIRNYALTGNPVYPLHQSSFDHREQKSKVQKASEQEQLGPLLTRKVVHGESLPYILMIPLRIFFEGKDDDPKYFDGRLNPLLLGFPLLLVFFRRNIPAVSTREIHFFTLFVILVVLYTFFTANMRVRYVVNIVPPMVVLSIYGLHALWSAWEQRKKRGWNYSLAGMLMAALLAAYFVPNVRYMAELYKNIDPMPYLEGRVDRNGYITRHLGEYPLVRLLNQHKERVGRVLALYLGDRRYYFGVDVVMDNDFFWDLAKRSRNGAEFRTKLMENGITHILVRRDLLRNVLEARDEPTSRLVLEFFGKTHLQASVNVYSLYDLDVAGEPPM